MRINNKNRLIVLSSMVIGIISLSLISIMSNHYVNASTNKVQETISASITMNLFIEGIDGESIIDGRENSVDIIAYSHSISNPYDPTTGLTTVKKHAPLRVVKEIDKATPHLFTKCLEKEVIPSVILKFYNGELEYYAIELQDARITSIQGYGSTAADDRPMETVSFTYVKIIWSYTEFDELGKPAGTIYSNDTWIETPT